MSDRPAAFRDRIEILKPLAVRDFAFLWTGMTVSMIGDGIYLVSIAWQVLSIENRPGALALVGIAWSLPQVVLVMASGALSDRVDRRVLMIAGDAIRFVAIGTLGLLSVTDQLTIPIVIGLVVVYGAGQAVFQPAFSAITPAIVPADLLVQANSLAQLVRPFAMTLVGPLVGGLLITWFDVGVAFLADAATFAFSAVDDPGDAEPSAPRGRRGGAEHLLRRRRRRAPVRAEPAMAADRDGRRDREPARRVGTLGDARPLRGEERLGWGGVLARPRLRGRRRRCGDRGGRVRPAGDASDGSR